jgi:hypothetical protein
MSIGATVNKKLNIAIRDTSRAAELSERTLEALRLQALQLSRIAMLLNNAWKPPIQRAA